MYPSVVGFINVNWTGSVRTNSSIRTSSGIQGINFFINRTILRSDRGTGFINSSVHDLCARKGCNVEYSCPGQLGKYQNGLVERRIKEIGRIARCGKEMSGVPDLASSYCVLHS